MNARFDEERRFHDSLVEDPGGRPANRFYAVNASSWAFYRRLLVADSALAARRGNVRILEYGSGAGAYSSRALAAEGLPVIGVDISEASVRKAQERAASEFPGADLDYRVMNAEALEFDAASFDVVCGNGILHHLDLERSFAEVARVLRPNGAAIFSEPLGHNPLINLYRRLTPTQRTEDEHPLRMRDVDLAQRYFRQVDAWFFHLLVLLALPLRRTFAFERVQGALDTLDRAILRSASPLRRYAWIVVLRLAQPVAPTEPQRAPQPPQ